ncbi:MAG: hypothetical protein ACXABV_16160 [Candidatus Thorarchaeota archaeon]
MGNEYYYEDKSRNEQLVSFARNAKTFILAGLLGAILALVGSLVSTFITLAIWPIGPLPYTPLIALISGTFSNIRTFAVLLLILGIYGLSVQYDTPLLLFVAGLDGVVLALIEISELYMVATGDFAGLAALGLGTFIVGSAASIIFGIMLLRLRDRSPQPDVFTVYGLVEVMWPFVYLSVTLIYVSLAYIMSQSAAILIGILSVILYSSELRKGTTSSHDDASDWSQPPDIWE